MNNVFSTFNIFPEYVTKLVVMHWFGFVSVLFEALVLKEEEKNPTGRKYINNHSLMGFQG